MNLGVGEEAGGQNAGGSTRSLILAGVVSWIGISAGFFGLKLLMQERPEFVGPPIRTAKAVLVQESPRLVARHLSDDVSVIRPVQPEMSDVRFQMSGRRDYRGLKTVSDMSGTFTARYALTNRAAENVFVLFKCPHPRADGGSADGSSVIAGGLRLTASVAGVQENAKDAWLWSGTIPAHGAVSIEVAYEVASLRAVVYRVADQRGTPLNRVRVTFDRVDLESMHFESGDGSIRAQPGPVVWERMNFLGPDSFTAGIVEERNLFTALLQLAEIGPLISLLFLVAVLAIIQARQSLTAVQLFTISAGYALYFPLILYLSARFSFGVALVIAVAVPGVLLLNYARWLIGRAGLVGWALFLGLYQVFPTLAAFGGWNRGLVLLCLGVVTLAVLIQLQNRALRGVAVAGSRLVVLLAAFSVDAGAAQVQVVLPAELAHLGAVTNSVGAPPLIGYRSARYQIRHDAGHFTVEVRLALEVVRPGETPVPLLTRPVHLQEIKIESVGSNLVRLVNVTNRLGLLAERAGQATVSLAYRVPVEHRDGRQRAEIPLLLGTSGQVEIDSTRADLDFAGGSLWGRNQRGERTIYELGVAGEEFFVIEWSDQSRAGTGRLVEADAGLYGIGLKRAQHLTVIHSDGSCTHFAEFELPAASKDDFRLRLPPGAQLISASVNGAEVRTPLLEGGLCRVTLPARVPGQSSHRLSFRLSCPPVRLGFVGTIELTPPEVFQTAGTLEWVVSLPDGFDTQVISSGLESQSAGADFSAFGDYGTVLKSHAYTRLTKTLAPPGKTSATLKYRQVVPAL